MLILNIQLQYSFGALYIEISIQIVTSLVCKKVGRFYCSSSKYLSRVSTNKMTYIKWEEKYITSQSEIENIVYYIPWDIYKYDKGSKGRHNQPCMPVRLTQSSDIFSLGCRVHQFIHSRGNGFESMQVQAAIHRSFLY